jgi:hypothetical protein
VKNHPFETFVIAIAALAAAGTVAAQIPGRDRDTRSITAKVPTVSVDAADMARLNAQNINEQVRDQLAQLEEDMKFAPGQRGLWMAYKDKVQKLVDDIARTRSVERFPKGTAAQQFELLGDTARNRLTAVEDIVDAGKALYAALDQRQQELADRRLARLPLPLLNGNLPASALASETPSVRMQKGEPPPK